LLEVYEGGGVSWSSGVFSDGALLCLLQSGLSPSPARFDQGAKTGGALKITPACRPDARANSGEGRETGPSSRAQKNIMKTKSNKNQSSELKSRPEQLSTDKNTAAQPPAAAPAEPAKSARILPYVNFKQRDENRALPT
jgi:hypothetical protein